MKFTYKTDAEVQAMTEQEANDYAVAKRTHEADLQTKAIDVAVKGAKEAFTIELTKANDSVTELAAKVLELETKGALSVNESALVKGLKEQKVAIKEVAKGGSNEVVIKAISNRASVVGNEHDTVLAGVGQLATRKLSLYDIFSKVPVSDPNNNGTIRYYDWDDATTVRAAASIAEGVAFPSSTAKFKTATAIIEKIGDTLPVTEEFMEDDAMFAAELELFLDTNVQLIIDEQICNGVGTSNTLVGLYQSSPAFTPVASGIIDANIFDLVLKVSEDITVSGGSRFAPDTIIARKSVINQMKLKKDGNNNYMTPPFVSADGKNIDGMLVIESNVAPANTLVVCDRQFGRIYEKTGIVLSKGMVANQFVEDAMTLKARKRLAFLIKNSDKGGFRKVTSISAALVTLAS
jgi:hypothetical protein